MQGLAVCLGERLHSVALRYCSPLRGDNYPLRRVFSPAGESARLSAAEAAPPETCGPTARWPALARLEAVLLLAQEPTGSRKLATLAGLADGTEARTLVRALNGMYDSEGCAFRAVEVAGGFQLMSRPKFAPWLRRLHGQPEVRLSAPAMETLAVVAYRQPVLRADVEAIRGVQCGEILRQLMDHDLVRIVGRSDDLGRPFLYGTTKRFLQLFGLRHLDELPRPEWVRHESTPIETIHSSKMEGDSNVKTAANMTRILEETLDPRRTALYPEQAAKKPDEEDEFEEDEADGEEDDFDDDLDDEDEDYDDDFEEEDEDLEEEEEGEEEEEDLEDEWEEVGDEDEDEEEEEDEDEDEEEDDWEDDDWDEDDDWEDEDEEDWD